MKLRDVSSLARAAPRRDPAPSSIRNGEASADVEQPWVKRLGNDDNGREVVAIIDTTGAPGDFAAERDRRLPEEARGRGQAARSAARHRALSRFPDTTIGPELVRGWIAKAMRRAPFYIGALLASSGTSSPSRCRRSCWCWPRSPARALLRFGQLFAVGVYALDAGGAARLRRCRSCRCTSPGSWLLYPRDRHRLRRRSAHVAPSTPPPDTAASCERPSTERCRPAARPAQALAVDKTAADDGRRDERLSSAPAATTRSCGCATTSRARTSQRHLRDASAPRPSVARWWRSPSARRARRRCSCRAASTPARSTARTPASSLLRELLDGKLRRRRSTRSASCSCRSSTSTATSASAPNNRPNQVGPEEMGWRTTAQNLNLNRDYVKAEAPEMRAHAGAAATRGIRSLYVDLHVTDGAEFQHDVAVLVRRRPASPTRRPRSPPRHARCARGSRRSSTATGTCRSSTSTRLREARGSGRRLRRASPAAALLDAYWAARNRLGILVETHSWKDYADARARHARRARRRPARAERARRRVAAGGARRRRRVARRQAAHARRGSSDVTKPRHHRLPRLRLHAHAVADLDGDAHRVRHHQARGLAHPALRRAPSRRSRRRCRAPAGSCRARSPTSSPPSSPRTASPSATSTARATLDVESLPRRRRQAAAETFEGRADGARCAAAGATSTRTSPTARSSSPSRSRTRAWPRTCSSPKAPDSLDELGLLRQPSSRRRSTWKTTCSRRSPQKMLHDPAVKAECEQALTDPDVRQEPAQAARLLLQEAPVVGHAARPHPGLSPAVAAVAVTYSVCGHLDITRCTHKYRHHISTEPRWPPRVPAISPRSCSSSPVFCRSAPF